MAIVSNVRPFQSVSSRSTFQFVSIASKPTAPIRRSDHGHGSQIAAVQLKSSQARFQPLFSVATTAETESFIAVSFATKIHALFLNSKGGIHDLTSCSCETNCQGEMCTYLGV